MWCGLPEECLPARLSSFVEDTFKYHNIVKSREKLLKTNTTSSKMDSEDSERNGYWRISHEADGEFSVSTNVMCI